MMLCDAAYKYLSMYPDVHAIYKSMSISSLFTYLNQSYLLFVDSWTHGYFPLNWIFIFLRWILFLFFGHTCILKPGLLSSVCIKITCFFPLCYLNLNLCL